ncbi:universal stress protein [Thiohalophilus sp.]|uniref:universal stress protein n=1 Tax=Thiohalophilus sp. TaxID=3028392 RepID=UPI002ACDF564|nr:universal stress protein [Thiohalophilus sp.]MDZ7663571.1 universal stress protein [Thiohalophilus sp.]
MYKHILVAIDGSETAQHALKAAIRLAKVQQSELLVVHVINEISMSLPEGGYVPDVQEAFRESGREILRQAESDARKAGVTAETILLEIDKFGQNAADMIVAEAENRGADLIVIGSHGRRGIRRLLLGSIAESVMRLASRPVLLIRGE